MCLGGQWGTICSDSDWNDVDAGVICSQLGFSRYGTSEELFSYCYFMNICTVGSLVSNWFSEYQLLTFLNAVHCNGSETSIFECQYNQNDRSCPTWSDASVICYGL